MFLGANTPKLYSKDVALFFLLVKWGNIVIDCAAGVLEAQHGVENGQFKEYIYSNVKFMITLL